MGHVPHTVRGVLATVHIPGIGGNCHKESLDLWTKGHWSWDDFVFGVMGWIMGAYFVGLIA
jgi:hypothetical protein